MRKIYYNYHIIVTVAAVHLLTVSCVKKKPESCEGARNAMKASDSPTFTGCSVELIFTTGTGI